jgi:hypothetical protein
VNKTNNKLVAKKLIWINNRDISKLDERVMKDLSSFVEIYNENLKLAKFGFDFYNEIKPKVQKFINGADDYIARRRIDKENLLKYINSNSSFQSYSPSGKFVDEPSYLDPNKNTFTNLNHEFRFAFDKKK